MSMWEIQLLISYHDYNVDLSTLTSLEEKAEALLCNITPTELREIEGTTEQSKSDKWTQNVGFESQHQLV